MVDRSEASAGTPPHPHGRDDGDQHRGGPDLQDVADPVDPAGEADPEHGGEPVADQGAHDAEHDGQPQRDVLPAWDDGLGDQPDDESGDDRPEDVEHPRPPRGEVTLWSGQWNGGQQVEVERTAGRLLSTPPLVPNAREVSNSAKGPKASAA